MSLRYGLLLSNALRRRCRGDDAICSLRHRELKQGQENLLPTRADPLGDAGTPGCQANDPMQLARTRMLPAVAGKHPGLTGRHPALLARDPPPFMQYLKKDGRENHVTQLQLSNQSPTICQLGMSLIQALRSDAVPRSYQVSPVLSGRCGRISPEPGKYRGVGEHLPRRRDLGHWSSP